MPTTTSSTRFTECPTPEHVVAIVDPRAGRGLGRRVIELLQMRDWGARVKLFTPDPANLNTYTEAVRYARQYEADRLLVSGGDGTLMRVVSAMLDYGGSPLPISLVPTGTGNVVAGDLHLPRRVLPALRLAFNQAKVHWWDAGFLPQDGYHFTLRASAGHDANALVRVSKQAKLWWRAMAYVGPAIREFIRMEPIRFTLTIDDQPPLEMMGATAFVAVSSRLSGSIGFVLSNQMRTDDGVLYAGVFHPQKLLRSVPHLLHHLAFEAENFPQMVSLFPVHERVEIDADPQQLTQLDGEMLAQTPLVAEVVPQSLPFVTHPRHFRKITRRFSSSASS